MKKTFLLFCCHVLIIFVCSSDLLSQNSNLNYDLSQYKLPDLKRRVLELNFDLDGSGYRTEDHTINEIAAWNRKRTTDNFQWGGQVISYYSLYINRDKLKAYQSFSCGMSLSGYRWNNTLEEGNTVTNPEDVTFIRRKHSDLHPQLSYSGEFQEFIVNRFFLAQVIDYRLGYDGSSDFWDEQDSLQQSVEDELNKDKYAYSDLEVSLLAGWGRIEHVEDARLAVYILDDLIKAGKLSREVTDEDIQQLAETISRLQNERFFDNREKQIWQLQQLDSVMQTLGLTESADMAYFTLLKDNWDYANGPVRSSGFQLAGGFRSGMDLAYSLIENRNNFYLQDSVYESGSDELSRNLRIGGLVQIIYEKPVNLYWQFSIYNSLLVSYMGWMSDYHGYDPEYDYTGNNQRLGPVIQDDLYISLGYYPNSRTSMSVYSSTSTNLSLLMDDEENRDRGITIYTGLGMDINYYISPRMRLNLDGTVYNTYTWSSNELDYTDRENRITGGISAGIVYKIL